MFTQACREMAGMSTPNGEGVIKEKGKGRMSVDENNDCVEGTVHSEKLGQSIFTI